MQQANVIQVMNDSLAQELLNSNIPARLAYTGSDGFPRVIPTHVLLVRGAASIEVVDGVVPEYLEACKKYVGAEQWPAFEAQVRATYKQQARITIVPEWAKLLDFETRVPTYMKA